MSATEIRNGVIAGLVMLVIGGAFVLYGMLTGSNMKKVEAAYSTAKALVTKRSERSNATESGLTPRSEVTTKFKVDLEYTVDGTTYKIKRTSRWSLHEGSTTVYYDPDNPKKVYTEEQVLGRYFTAWYLAGGIVGGLGLIVVIYVLTQVGKHRT